MDITTDIAEIGEELNKIKLSSLKKEKNEILWSKLSSSTLMELCTPNKAALFKRNEIM